MIQRLRVRLLYSYAGILLCGGLVFAAMQACSLLFRRAWMTPAELFRVFLAMAAAAALFLTASGISLIRHEGLRANNLVGTAFGFFWIGGNLFCLAVIRRFSGMVFLRAFIAAAGCFQNVLLTGMFIMAYAAACHKPAYDKDFVIIPGCSISKKGGLLPLLKGRTNRAIRFAWDQERASGKPVRYVPTGGQGPDEIMSEGSAMELYLLSHGAEPYEVLPEKASFNTWQNMLNSKKIIDAAKPGAKVCYVTTNYHVLRSGMLAAKAGLDAEGLASTTKWYFWPNGLIREFAAIFSMHRVQQAAAAVLCVFLALQMPAILLAG